MEVAAQEILYTEEDRQLIARDYRRLLRGVVMKDDDSKNIRMAFELAVEAHQRQRRKSGEPYILHPIEVARICVDEIGLGPTGVICALLHDVVEDTQVTLEEIESKFGKKIANIIDGLTKLDKAFAKDSPQAENFQKILKTLTQDVRVVLIKMADRLHNMRTIGSMAKDKQLKIASETVFIYAPLAHRLGLYNMKTEFQDMCMKVTDYENYKMIANKLAQTKTQRERYIGSFIKPLKERLDKIDELKDRYRVLGRPKAISSIWRKIQNKKVPFEEIYDLFAVRIIVDTPIEKEKFDCWKVYSIVTDIYKPIPDRLKDWVSTPKANGYESLHTTVVGPGGRFVEVQVRTERMDEIAEKGFAAHWKYKQIFSENVFDHWINSIREVLENPSDDAIQFINDFKSNLFAKEVFVYTPKGDTKIFPRGSTPLDFAFDVHSQVGYHCMSAKINGRLVPLNYQLQNGDKVSITTSKTQKPNESWLNLVVTSKAKSAIRSAMKEEKRAAGDFGKEALMRKFKSLDLTWSDENLDFLTKNLKLQSRVELFYQISQNKNFINKLKDFDIDANGRLIEKKAEEIVIQRPIISIPKEGAIKLPPKLMINGEDASKFAYTLAQCCDPVQGDEIFAFAAIGGGVRIHRTSCPNATSMMANYGYRVMRAEWRDSDQTSFVAELKITGIDAIGVVQQLTNTITTKLRLNMRSISMTGNAGFYEGRIAILVNNKDQLDFVLKVLKKENGVNSVVRMK
jgi:GTP diphosphokinase / guanosine-3',5'-bis(diphosphate) 3'-diphosphatase